MRTINRRSVIIGSAMSAVVPRLVKADSLFGIEGDAFSLDGMRSAVQWARERSIDQPAMRLCFSNGHKHSWCYYQYLSRWNGQSDEILKKVAIATSIELAVTDRNGNRAITILPIDYEVAVKFMHPTHRDRLPPKPLF